jgi:hypothetical protein
MLEETGWNRASSLRSGGLSFGVSDWSHSPTPIPGLNRDRQCCALPLRSQEASLLWDFVPPRQAFAGFRPRTTAAQNTAKQWHGRVALQLGIATGTSSFARSEKGGKGEQSPILKLTVSQNREVYRETHTRSVWRAPGSPSWGNGSRASSTRRPKVAGCDRLFSPVTLESPSWGITARA